MAKNILFLCTGNSARSIMAEAYMNHAAKGTWRAWSAGSKPVGAPNPFALETLSVRTIEAAGGDGPPRSKSWNDFTGPAAPLMDVIVTVCDNAAAEPCPVWPKTGATAPKSLHWSFPDPAAKTGSHAEKLAAFAAVFDAIQVQIDSFLAEQGQAVR